jgi:Maltokinase N-terminal cap domain
VPVALLYKATLTPSKIELLQTWVPKQPWLGDVDPTTVEAVGSYRFDDPAGEVGMETHLLRGAEGQILQVPVTYRGSPMAGADSLLIGTMQHSVLGERWVYDACGDPVYVSALATVILRGGTHAELDVATDAGQVRLDATTRVWGSGSGDSEIPPIGPVSLSNEGTATVIRVPHVEMTLLRAIDADSETGVRAGQQSLVGTWPGQNDPALLALAQIT